MKFGADFFKILNFIVLLLRLLGQVFGDEETKKEVQVSKEKTASPDSNEAC